MFFAAVATFVPVPITFCVAPARADMVALRAAVVVDADGCVPRATVVRPDVAARVADAFDVLAAGVRAALRADTALRADVVSDCAVALLLAAVPRRC